MTNTHHQRAHCVPVRLVILVVITSVYALVVPVYAGATVTQDVKDTITTDAPKSSGGWTQQLGTGLLGTPGRITIPVIVTGGPPFSFSPNPFLEFHECDDATYSQCRWFSGSGPVPSPFTPQHLNEIPIDSVFSVDMSAMSALNPAKYYLMSFGLSIVRGAGSIQVRGSSTDTFAHGATDASGLADLAFTIEGIDRATIATTTSPTPPEPTPPTNPEPPEPLVSSVLFLPGFKGSELFRTNATCPLLGVASTALGGTGCDWKLWLPAADSEVSQLFLTPQGESRNADIYTRADSVLSSALGRKFYTSFIETMERAEESASFGTGWQFEPAAYDWRLASAAIATRGTPDSSARIRYSGETSIPYLQSRIRALASTSPTGKVTIVGHSYGGIVARALAHTLGGDASTVIDSLILVGTPEHGAPRALGALLFGDREAIPGVSFLPNFLLTNATARTFGLSSPAAYELLPDASYFEQAPATDRHILRFAHQGSFSLDRQAYGEGIDSRPELLAYATAATIPRPQPSDRDLTRPAVLSSYLIANAENADHARDRALPASIAIHRIAGWGGSTLSGFEYRERQRFVLGAPIGSTTVYIPAFTQSGDGVVPYWSAAGAATGATQDHRLDLPALNQGAQRIAHANLLEAPQTQALIANILRGTDSPTMNLRRAVAVNEVTTRLRVMVFGSATLSLNDEEGNQTGAKLDGTYTEDIPNSTYGEIGAYSYVEIPSGQAYEVRIQATGNGVFTVSFVEEDERGTSVITSILDIPSTDATSATMTIGSDDSLSALAVDLDGDGTVDVHNEPSLGNEVPYSHPAKSVADDTVPSTQSGFALKSPPKSLSVSNNGAPIASTELRATSSVEQVLTTTTGAIAASIQTTSQEDTVRDAEPIEDSASTTQSEQEHMPWWLQLWRWLVRLVSSLTLAL